MIAAIMRYNCVLGGEILISPPRCCSWSGRGRGSGSGSGSGSGASGGHCQIGRLIGRLRRWNHADINNGKKNPNPQ